MDVNDQIKAKLREQADTESVSANATEAKFVKLLISTEELKFIIVLIENIAELTQAGVLELTEAEKASADLLYQNTLTAAQKYLGDKDRSPYSSQLDHLRRRSPSG